MHFFSISNPSEESSFEISELVTEPNNLSFSDLALIFSSNFSSFLTILLASSTACFSFT
jgi:hypothetical protein